VIGFERHVTLQSYEKAMGWCAVHCAKTIEEKELEERKKNILTIWQLLGLIFLQCFFLSLRSLDGDENT